MFQQVIGTTLQREFTPVNGKSFFGFLRNGITARDVEEVLKSCINDSDGGYSPRQGGAFENWYVRKLGCDEITGEASNLPARFTNHLIVHARMRRVGPLCACPIPLGLVYYGTPADFLIEKPNMYEISENIEGVPLFNKIKDITDKSFLVRYISQDLRELQDRGIYLMDFAPRDIVLRNGKERNPIFVDFEHVDYRGMDNNRNCDSLVEKQAIQARQDWEMFLSCKEMSLFEGKLRRK